MTRRHILAAALAAAASAPAMAVTISGDGHGQALLYPYYTVRAVDGNAFNTYVSIVNAHASTKALRVRFREARNGREVASLNVYLSPNDVWTAAIVPDGDGTRLLSTDNSCTDPALGAGLVFSNAAYTGTAADGAGTGLDRTREGYLEVLEMATLAGGSALDALQGSTGVPANCAALRGTTVAQDAVAPSGGLSGALTLINVASGQDFTTAAEALDLLATRPYFRPPSDAYPSFAAAEIDPVSLVIANGALYRSLWPSGLEAVNAALTRQVNAEYVIDAPLNAGTDLVLTLPTASLRPPRWQAGCGGDSGTTGDAVAGAIFDRDQRGDFFPMQQPLAPSQPAARLCGAANVLTVRAGNLGRTVFGSTVDSLSPPLQARSGFNNGRLRLSSAATLTSLAASTRTSLDTGLVTNGSHAFTGLPVVGLMARSLQNGLLACGAATCQGNYGGAYPLAYRRTIAP